MSKLLIVVDMQNDFITGTLGSSQAQNIVPQVKRKIEVYRQRGDKIIFTRDTHYDNYPETQEGEYLPIVHCIKGTEGHEIEAGLKTEGCEVFDKTSFGSLLLAKQLADTKEKYNEIELCGLCSDICVVSNALILKAQFPEIKVTVDALCCAGVTEESHKAALLTMKMCQINVLNQEEERT